MPQAPKPVTTEQALDIVRYSRDRSEQEGIDYAQSKFGIKITRGMLTGMMKCYGIPTGWHELDSKDFDDVCGESMFSH
jgi:hypothetical protein